MGILVYIYTPAYFSHVMGVTGLALSLLLPVVFYHFFKQIKGYVFVVQYWVTVTVFLSGNWMLLAPPFSCILLAPVVINDFCDNWPQMFVSKKKEIISQLASVLSLLFKPSLVSHFSLFFFFARFCYKSNISILLSSPGCLPQPWRNCL